MTPIVKALADDLGANLRAELPSPSVQHYALRNRPWLARPIEEVHREQRWHVVRDLLAMLVIIVVVCAAGIVGVPA